MIEFCRKNGTPEPDFREYAGGFAVVFPFKEVMNTEAVLQSEAHFHLTSRQKEILQILQAQSSMSAKEIIETLESPPAPRTLRDDLMYLKKNKLIDSEGHAKTTRWFLVVDN